MIVKLNTNMVPLFAGTYETVWEPTECNDDGEELALEYEMKALMQSIVNVYQEHAGYIVKEWNVPWIKSINFTGSDSPREYNFRTDELDFTLEINKNMFDKVLRELKGNEAFEKFLNDHYTSYDGFMSFTPNTYSELVLEIQQNGNEYDQAIAAVVAFFTHEKRADIEADIHESWAGNGYGGLDYTIENE